MSGDRSRRARSAATIALTAGLLATTVGSPASAAPSINRISLIAVGTYASGVFGGSAAEIVAHDPVSQRPFVVNADAGLVDVLDIADPTEPELIDTIVAAGSVNSVDVQGGVVAVASQADPTQDPGFVELFDTDGNRLASVQVGALPDMLTFTPDGMKVVVANEGEPAGYCDGDAGDAEGSVISEETRVGDLPSWCVRSSGRVPPGRRA